MSLRANASQRAALLLQLLRFGVVGCVTLVLYTGLFYLLAGRSGSNFVAALVSGLIAALVSYILQRNWTFRSRAAIEETLVKFLAIHACAALINAACVAVLTGPLGFETAYGLIVGAIVYGTFSYLAQKLWCFRV